ncbi:neutral zinc metallopeptidase [Saccharopolyspora antimicrobica]|nr:neutral zinc metallopeptidase [Saccharopolyspora antimicrobica]
MTQPPRPPHGPQPPQQPWPPQQPRGAHPRPRGAQPPPVPGPQRPPLPPPGVRPVSGPRPMGPPPPMPPRGAAPHGPPPPMPPMRPPKRKGNGGVIIALVLVGVTLCGITLVGAMASAITSDRASDYDSSPTSGTSSSSTRTTTSRTSSSSTTSSTTSETSGYDYSTQVQPVARLGDHPINIQNNGAVNTPCDLPTFRTDVESQDRFYQAALPCLVEAWRPLLEEADLPVRTPKVVTSGSDFETPCGTRKWNQTAMYCPGSHTIYMTARYYAEKEQLVEPGAYLGQFAHEFGHAVQGMSGISTAFGDAAYDAGGRDTPSGLELTRRSELQATCFGGMTLAALQNGGVSNDYIFPALYDSRGRGDEHSNVRDHGTTKNNNAWVDQGFYKNEITQCNTWLAAASDVS